MPPCWHTHFANTILLFLTGAAVKVYLTCNDGHEEEWSSSKNVKAGRKTVPLVNLLIVCFALFSGLHWTQFKVRTNICC